MRQTHFFSEVVLLLVGLRPCDVSEAHVCIIVLVRPTLQTQCCVARAESVGFAYISPIVTTGGTTMSDRE